MLFLCGTLTGFGVKRTSVVHFLVTFLFSLLNQLGLYIVDYCESVIRKSVSQSDRYANMSSRVFLYFSFHLVKTFSFNMEYVYKLINKMFASKGLA